MRRCRPPETRELVRRLGVVSASAGGLRDERPASPPGPGADQVGDGARDCPAGTVRGAAGVQGAWDLPTGPRAQCSPRPAWWRPWPAAAAAPATRPAVAARQIAAWRRPSAPRDPGRSAAADTAFGLDVLARLVRGVPGAEPGVLARPPWRARSAWRTWGRGARPPPRWPGAAPAGRRRPGGLAAGLQARSDALGGLNGPGVTLSAEQPGVGRPVAAAAAPATSTRWRPGTAPAWPRAPFLTDPAKAASQVNQVISADTRGHISQASARRTCSPTSAGC